MQDTRMADLRQDRTDVVSPKRVFENVHVIFCDVDGVFTDGKTWQDAQGQWRRTFSVRDTMGVRALRKASFRVCVLTPVLSNEIKSHFETVGVDAFKDHCLEPEKSVEQILKSYGLTREHAAFISENSQGSVELRVGEAAVYTATRLGGDGAFLEISNLILQHAAFSEALPVATRRVDAREF